jgi:parallel beta-helix repeat protein
VKKRSSLLFTVLLLFIFSGKISGETKLNDKVITENTVWSGDVIVIGVAVVERNIVLTISPGTVVKFITPDGALEVKGTLSAEGTYEKKITFTSYYESASAEKWAGIKFSGEKKESAPSKLSNCVIKYAATGIKCFEAPTVNIENCTFSKNNLAVNYTQEANGFISHNEFIENTDGGIVCDQVKLKINNNNFMNNTKFAIICAKKSEVDIEENFIAGSEKGILFSLVGTIGHIRNNIIQENKFGIFTEKRVDLDINNNTLRDNEYGIYIIQGTFTRITGNEITGNRIGVFIAENFNLGINENNIYNNKEFEIRLENASGEFRDKLRSDFIKDSKADVPPCMREEFMKEQKAKKENEEISPYEYIDARRNFWGEEITKEMKANGVSANISKIMDYYDSPTVNMNNENYKMNYIMYSDWKDSPITGAGAKTGVSYGVVEKKSDEQIIK